MSSSAKRKTDGARQEQCRDMNIRRLVMRHAEGNVSLHKGRYLTQADVDRVVDRALSHDFSAYTKKR